jgi:hypothetical protein
MREVVQAAVKEAELYAADMFNFHGSVKFKPILDECFENKEVFVCYLNDCRYIPSWIFKDPKLYLIVYPDGKSYHAELYLRINNEIFQFGDDGGMYKSGFGFLKLYFFRGKIE